MKNEEKIKQWGLEEKLRYYYLRFPDPSDHSSLAPHGKLGGATVCIIPALYNSDCHVYYARGVAFCNPKDQFVKKTGRAIALGRAVKAIETHGFTESIHKTTPACILTEYLGWVYLSTWNDSLTEYEAKLFQEKEEK